MAKGKGKQKTPSPAPPTEVTVKPRRRADAPPWRDFITVLLLLLGGAATAFVWFHTPPPPAHGLQLTEIVWVVTLLGVLGRLQARHTVRQLEEIVTRNEIVTARLEPEITEAQTGLFMRHIPAWIVLGLGVIATLVIWQTNLIERYVGKYSPATVGIALSALVALMVAVNTINRWKVKRLSKDLRTALHSERLALGTLGALDVMISACLPSGERTRFNECFQQFVGRTAAQLHGHGWLEVVHDDDRQRALELVAKPLNGKRTREHDVCLRKADGTYVWLHETLTPRFDEKGNLIEFVCTAINITQFVENEAQLDKQMGALKNETDEMKAKHEDVKDELSKTKTSRNRFEKGLEEAREDIKNLQDALTKAEATIEKTQIEGAAKIKDIKAESEERTAAIEQAAESRASKTEELMGLTKQEQQQTEAEAKKMIRAFEKLQEEMGQARQENSEIREQMTRHMKETREAKAEAIEAHKNEAQHRAKSDRLMQQVDELKAQVAAKDKAVSDAQSQAERTVSVAAADLEMKLQEASAQALATQLRKQIDAMHRMTAELLATALDGPRQDAAHNSAATLRVMSDLVDQALANTGSTPKPKSTRARSAKAASFDIRRTAQGVRDLLVDGAIAKSVQIEVEFAHNLASMVHGEDVEIRSALLSLTDAALQLVNEGSLVMRLSEEVSTPAHATIRCELKNKSARVKGDVLEAALAMKSTDDAMPDAIKQPAAHQAAKAWKTIRALDGKHGYLLPEEGGFSIWFTFTLSRPTAMRADVASIAAGAIPPISKPTGAPEPTTVESSAAVRPAMPRMPQELLNCSLGEVAELGADSARVFCAKPPKGTEVTITFDEFDAEFKCEVLWSKKISGKKHDVGLKFLGLTSGEQKAIHKIAMQHRRTATMTDMQ